MAALQSGHFRTQKEFFEIILDILSCFCFNTFIKNTRGSREEKIDLQ